MSAEPLDLVRVPYQTRLQVPIAVTHIDRDGYKPYIVSQVCTGRLKTAMRAHIGSTERLAVEKRM